MDNDSWWLDNEWYQIIWQCILTHWGRVTHLCVGNLTVIGSDCWIIVNWTLRNKFQWNLNRNSNIFIQENAFESVVCEMAAILSRPQCVKRKCLSRTHYSEYNNDNLPFHSSLHSFEDLCEQTKSTNTLSSIKYQWLEQNDSVSV